MSSQLLDPKPCGPSSSKEENSWASCAAWHVLSLLPACWASLPAQHPAIPGLFQLLRVLPGLLSFVEAGDLQTPVLALVGVDVVCFYRRCTWCNISGNSYCLALRCLQCFLTFMRQFQSKMWRSEGLVRIKSQMWEFVMAGIFALGASYLT